MKVSYVFLAMALLRTLGLALSAWRIQAAAEEHNSSVRVRLGVEPPVQGTLPPRLLIICAVLWFFWLVLFVTGN